MDEAAKPSQAQVVLITIAKVIGVLASIYFFLMGLDMMGSSFLVLGGKGAGDLFTIVDNPVTGLMVGILATVLVQSSSTSTSIVVGLVGAGQVTVKYAAALLDYLLVVAAGLSSVFRYEVFSSHQGSRRRHATSECLQPDISPIRCLFCAPVILPVWNLIVCFPWTQLRGLTHACWKRFPSVAVRLSGLTHGRCFDDPEVIWPVPSPLNWLCAFCICIACLCISAALFCSGARRLHYQFWIGCLQLRRAYALGRLFVVRKARAWSHRRMVYCGLYVSAEGRLYIAFLTLGLTFTRVPEARKARGSRLRDGHFRGLDLSRRPSIGTRCADPLLGGALASKVTRRKREERGQIQQLQASVQRLEATISAMHDGSTACFVGRRKPARRRRPKAPATTSFAPSEPSQTLWARLQPLMLLGASAAAPPSDDEVRKVLLRLLGADPPGAPMAPAARPLSMPRSAPQPDKPVKPQALPATFADAVRQGLSNAPKPTPKQPPRTAGDTFARLAASGCAKPAKAGKKPSLAQAGWKCQVVTANAIHHQATGPRVVTAHTAEQLQDVLNWASASKPEHPTTLVDFVSEDTTHKVLVRLPGAPSLSLQKVKLHQLTADGPMPDGLAVKSEFDDDREFADTSKADWKVFRLTLVREFADASRFADGCNRPQGLPGMMLSPALASKVVRTFAVAVYETEVTCLIKVRIADAALFNKAKPWPGAFLQVQRDPDSHIAWFARRDAETTEQYFARVSAEAASAEGRCLAYRPGGRANLGVRSRSQLPSLDGSIAPRWILSNAPQDWLTDEVSLWLANHGFASPSQLQRAGPAAWYFRAWPKEGVGLGVYANGFVVSPASGGSSKKKKALSTVGPVWGAGCAKTGDSAAKPPAAVVSPADAATKEEDADMKDGTETGAQERTRSRSRGRQASSQPNTQEAQSSAARARPRMPHDSKFDTVECGGAGDCAFTSIATALARWANTGATPKDLAPGGKLQGWLRCEAAKFMRQKRDEFADIGNPDSMATAVARAGSWADSPALCALAGALRLQFRIWAFDSVQNVWRLHLVGPDPGRNAPKKPRKASAQPAVVWLVLVDRHYQWLRPKGDDWILEEAVPGNAIRVHSSANLEILRGAGKASAASSASSRAAGRGSGGSCARLLGLRRSASGGASCKTSGASSCARLLGIQNPLSVASAASSARKLLGLGRQTRASEASLPPEQLLGVEAAAAAHEPYKKGDLYLCPCGWRPAEGTGADMRRRAQLHWRLCQGTAPPPSH